MAIFNNGTGKFLAGAFDRGITSIKDYFDIDQNAKREEKHKLDRIQDDEDSVYKEKEKDKKEEEATSFFSRLFGGASSDDSDKASREPSSRFWNRDPGQDRQEENDLQERDNRQREAYERQERENSEREDYERRSRDDDERRSRDDEER